MHECKGALLGGAPVIPWMLQMPCCQFIGGTLLQKCFISDEGMGLYMQQCTHETVMDIKIGFLLHSRDGKT